MRAVFRYGFRGVGLRLAQLGPGKPVAFFGPERGKLLTLNAVLPSGAFIVSDNGGTTSTIQYLYSPGSSTPVPAGPTFNMAGYATANSNPYSSTTGASFQISTGGYVQTFKFANQAGSIAGTANRYVVTPSATSYSAGTDDYLYVPSVSDPVSGSDIIIGNQGTLARLNTANTPDNTIYYAYNTSQSVTINGTNTPFPFTQRSLGLATNNAYSASSTPTGLNANNQLLVTASRYIGVNTTGETTNLGTDAFLFTPAANNSATGTIVQVGLTGQNYGYYANSGSLYALTVQNGYTGNASAYQTSTSAPVALNNGGAVVGTTTRYQTNTPTTLSAAVPLGTDAWVYSGATALGTTGGTAPIGTVQVGLAGNSVPATLGGYYSVSTSVGTYESSAVIGISTAGAVTGTSMAYPSNTSTGTSPGTALGQEAWQFKPTLVGGSGLTTATGTGYGPTAAGTYVQLGLVTPATATTLGYQTSGGLRSSTVSIVNAAGNAAGTSVRYLTTAATTTSGADAWYYNGTNTTLITPTANASYSNYVRSDGLSTSAVLATSISAAGTVAGTQSRYAPGATTAAGTDAWAYSPVTNNTYVIASPSIIANDADFAANKSSAGPTEYFNAAVLSVSDNGLVIGTFAPSPGASGGTTLGTFVYAWTQQAGTVVLGSTSNLSSSSMVAALTLNGSSGTAYISTSSLYADSAGDIFGIGNSTSGSGTTEAFEFAAAAAPEPTSLALLGLALTPLAGRRRRRSPVSPGTPGGVPPVPTG